MPSVLIRHKVRDYARWRPVYDEHAGARKAGGCKDELVFRNAEDPDEVVLLFEWDDIERARKFIGSDDLREKMKEAGVEGSPDVRYLEGA